MFYGYAFFFWAALFFIFYANAGYLLLLVLITRFYSKPWEKGSILPTVTLLIAARNEEKIISQKLENTLALDYPGEKLQIIVVSDASVDATEEIVANYGAHGIELQRVPDGRGKVNALNATLPKVRGEILIISDADSMYRPDAIKMLVRNFADPTVGAVTGEEIRVAAEDGSGLGESIYVRIDNQIKKLEAAIESMVMVNGGFFAVRRELYPVLEPHLIHDAIVPCRLQLEGYRTVYEPEALSVEVYGLDVEADFRRRLRTVIQAFYSYLYEAEALNPLRTGFFAFSIFSHRFTRWFVWPALVVALLSSILLAPSYPLYRWALYMQGICYLMAAAGYLMERYGVRIKPFYIPYYFVYIHTAAFVAILQGLLGKRLATWQPTVRAPGDGVQVG